MYTIRPCNFYGNCYLQCGLSIRSNWPLLSKVFLIPSKLSGGLGDKVRIPANLFYRFSHKRFENSESFIAAEV